MPRGGHSRVGPLPADAATRQLYGSRTRPQHRRVDPIVGDAAPDTTPPADLSDAERAYWSFYAAALVEARRFTPTCRDALAKYCVALAVIAELRQALVSRRRADRTARRETLRELRQWLLAARLIENDLLLSPAAALRAPQPAPHPAPDPFTRYDTPTH
jgi:hypothetical protein